MAEVPGTAGYQENAADLIPRYETIPFEVGYAKWLDLLPQTPSNILDIGAGTGWAAAHLASKGHHITAVEPTDAFREHGQTTHAHDNICWIDDGLPHLSTLAGHIAAFDVIMMVAVWMHLDLTERSTAMPVVSRLLKDGGILLMSLRHGPVPEGRIMYDVSAEETIALAQQHRLKPIQNVTAASIQERNKRAGVTWSHLAFRKDT